MKRRKQRTKAPLSLSPSLFLSIPEAKIGVEVEVGVRCLSVRWQRLFVCLSDLVRLRGYGGRSWIRCHPTCPAFPKFCQLDFRMYTMLPNTSCDFGGDLKHVTVTQKHYCVCWEGRQTRKESRGQSTNQRTSRASEPTYWWCWCCSALDIAFEIYPLLEWGQSLKKYNSARL